MKEQSPSMDILEQAHKRIKNLEEEISGLNAALKSLTISDNINTVFENLLDTLKNILDYDHACILFEVQPGQYMSYFATHYDFLEKIWKADELFKRLELGNAQVLDDIKGSQEWMTHSDLHRLVKSALHIPLKGTKHNAIFICTKNREDFFNSSHFKIASHFIPFATYAIKMLESNQLLKDEILERERVESENKRLQANFIENAYKEGFAENAISVLHNIGNLTTPLKLKFEEAKDLCPKKQITLVLEKLKEVEEPNQRSLIIDKVITILSDTNDSMNNLIDYGLEQTSKIAATITSQQKYANLKNKLKTKVNLNDIIKDVLNTHQGQLDKYKIQVILQTKELKEITVERNGIHHVLTNMMTNAIEAINERSKLHGDFNDKFIYLSLLESVKDEEYVYIVKDNGIGVTPEENQNLFTFGFTTKEDGSGFGLHNSGNFIRSQGGRIELESKGRNMGTTCRVYLPVNSKERRDV